MNDSAREMMSALKKFWGRIQGRYASTNTGNAYTLTPDVALAAYVTGERYSFRANAANTGAATLSISGLAAVTIKTMSPSGKRNLSAGDIQSGQPVTVEYDGTDLVMVTPPAGPIYRGALVRMSAAQSIPTGTLTTLTWDTEDRDTDAIHDPVTNNSRLTVPAGVTQVRLHANAQFQASSAGSFRTTELLKNGALVSGGFIDTRAPGASACIVNLHSAILDVTAGDFFAVAVQHDAGVALNVGAVNTWFEMEIVR